MPAPTPTVDFYASLQQAFDHFNARLFGGQLPPCLITMRSSARQLGYHHKDRFINSAGQMLDELGLHPGFFTLRPVEEVLSTLVHEMVHHWQDSLGQPSKSNPHNRQWAQKMRDIGLEPSATGLPEGKDTGHSMSHYIRPDGLFLQACRELLTQGFTLQWFDRHAPRTGYDSAARQQALAQAGVVVEVSPPPVQQIAPLPEGKPVVVQPPPPREVDRVRYVCSSCGIKAWARADVDIHCGACEQPLLAQGLAGS
ncbi:SprT-like domain-containing protein [Melaminivora sp.]